jgi:tetraacyldisaccharide 4'-kinase
MFLRKPKFWDQKRLNFISLILFPFTILITINNFLLARFEKTKPKKIFTICVGNIYVGGTGKTPLTIKLYQIIKKISKNVVTAKKFNKNHIDEIKLLKKNSNFITNSNRHKLINIALKKKVKVIIFDDGLQDRSINYNLKIICFDGTSWIGNGQLLPAGPMREKLDSLKKYDCVVLKNLPKKNKNLINKIRIINKDIKIFTSKYMVKNIDKFNLKKNYVIFAGIGNFNDFKNLLKNNKFKIVYNFNFPDHHKYKLEEISKIIEYAKIKNAKILTTEKDYVKIPKNFQNKIQEVQIEVKLNRFNEFRKFIKQSING